MNYLKITALIITVLFLGLFPACTTTQERDEMPENIKGQLTIFMNGPENAALDIEFDLFALNIVPESGDEWEVARPIHEGSWYTL